MNLDIKTAKKNMHDGQFEYLGRWVDKHNFRAFVYSKDEEKLAETYQQYTDLLASGLWFATREQASIKIRKHKDVIRADS